MRLRGRVTLRARLLGGLLLIVTAVIVVFDVATLTAIRSVHTQRIDDVLNQLVTSQRQRAAELFTAAEQGHLSSARPSLVPTDYYVAIITNDGEVVDLSDPPETALRLPVDLTAVARLVDIRTVGSADGGTFRLRATTTEVGVLFAAASLRPVNNAVHELQVILMVATVIALAVLAVAGAGVVRRGLAPLETIAAQADRITAGDLDRPVEPQTPDTEVGRLGMALNRMLARIHATVEEQRDGQERMRRFWADASHELRTPLTAVRVNAELYEQGVLTSRAQIDEAMRRIRISNHRMSALVDDMLRLARLQQQPSSATGPVDLTAVLTDCLEEVRALDQDYCWVGRIQPGLVVLGDPDLLRRAVDNLLVNIRAHTPVGTTGTLLARADGDHVVIEAGDDGPGVAESAIPRLFDRFYRADVHHTGTSSGAGLGLAIVAEVAASHGGTATAASVTPHGLCVRLNLPTGR